ncbi:MAG: putative ABC transporter permease [Candidatus Shapirobacteria bacterium]
MFELIWLFALYSLMGWILESSYNSYRHHKFINSGFLFGPFCPIYGVGFILITFFITPLQNNLFLFFIGAFAVTTILEYLTSLALEILFHTQWWDYSKEFLNIDGRICLRFSLYWAFLALFVIKFIHPQIVFLSNFLSDKLGSVGIIIVVSYFLIDLTITTISLYGLKHFFEALNLIHEKVDQEAEDLLFKKLRKPYLKLLKSFPDLKSKRYQIDKVQQRIRS